MATNIVVISVYGNMRENVGEPKLQWFKSYGQIKIDIEIRAIFLCILAQILNDPEGPRRMHRIS